MYAEEIDFTTATLDIHIRPHEIYDPFVDMQELQNAPQSSSASRKPVYDMRRGGKEAEEFRTHLTTWANEFFLRQQRTSLLQLIICGQYARFVRWDRQAAIVTERFNYREDPQPLAEFIWRFSHLTPIQRGWDATASLANQKEARAFKNAIRQFLEKLDSIEPDGRPHLKLPAACRTLRMKRLCFSVWKIQIKDEHTHRTTRIVVGRPFAGGLSETCGRATRAYLAYDLNTKKVCFFKDCWRYKKQGFLSEADTYHKLQAASVRHMPTVMYAGDVWCPQSQEVQTTKTCLMAAYMPQQSGKILRSTKYHHRIVQEVVYPLEEARDERELVQALHDAVICTFLECIFYSVLAHHCVF